MLANYPFYWVVGFALFHLWYLTGEDESMTGLPTAWSTCLGDDHSDAEVSGDGCLTSETSAKNEGEECLLSSNSMLLFSGESPEISKKIKQPKSIWLALSNMWCSKSCLLLVVFLSMRSCGASAGNSELKYKAIGDSPQRIAVYEAWFGESKHITVGYSTKDRGTIRKQIENARGLGITGFVVDWYGNRDPFIDQSYAEIQSVASKNRFNVAMMYDEGDVEEGATDQVIADLTAFHETYLRSDSSGRDAYLMYHGRPIIFVFPHGNHTDWARVRSAVNQWPVPPWLIQENRPGPHPDAFDGFYPWVNPGPGGWAADGSNWGDRYLTDFYKDMAANHADKIVVGGAWPQFDDRKASWSLNRKISARCGQTYSDSLELWKNFFAAGQVIPFMLVQTWNDYEEGSEIETGIKTCAAGTSSSP